MPNRSFSYLSDKQLAGPTRRRTQVDLEHVQDDAGPARRALRLRLASLPHVLLKRLPRGLAVIEASDTTPGTFGFRFASFMPNFGVVFEA
jgi:hypothetical protein